MTTTTSTQSPTLTASATPSCTTIAPQPPYGYIPPEACNSNWSYAPSFPAAVTIATFFGILTIAHIVLAILFRKGFSWVMIMGVGWELAAFVVRALAAHRQDSEAFAIVSNILFLLAPLWINAYVYMTAGRLIWTYHPDKKIWFFKAINIGKYFVWLDVLSFLVQGTGGVMLSPGGSVQIMEHGKTIYMTGTGVQQLFILLFSGLVIKFVVDVQGVRRPGGYFKERWQLVTWAVFAALALITVRIAFRIVEFSAGTGLSNPLPHHEGYALGLDAVPMILAIGVLAVFHPGLALRGLESEFPSRKERKAENKRRKAEKKALKSTRVAFSERFGRYQGWKQAGSSEVELNRL